MITIPEPKSDKIMKSAKRENVFFAFFLSSCKDGSFSETTAEVSTVTFFHSEP